jgi:hypothetical protein
MPTIDELDGLMDEIIRSFQDYFCEKAIEHRMDKAELDRRYGIPIGIVRGALSDGKEAWRKFNEARRGKKFPFKVLEEHACTICRLPDGTIDLTDCYTEIGPEIYHEEKECTRGGGERIGLFHTHPSDYPVPGVGDLVAAYNRDLDVSCISSVDGGGPRTLCFGIPEELHGKREELFRKLEEMNEWLHAKQLHKSTSAWVCGPSKGGTTELCYIKEETPEDWKETMRKIEGLGFRLKTAGCE